MHTRHVVLTKLLSLLIAFVCSTVGASAAPPQVMAVPKQSVTFKRGSNVAPVTSICMEPAHRPPAISDFYSRLDSRCRISFLDGRPPQEGPFQSFADRDLVRLSGASEGIALRLERIDRGVASVEFLDAGAALPSSRLELNDDWVTHLNKEAKRCGDRWSPEKDAIAFQTDWWRRQTLREEFKQKGWVDLTSSQFDPKWNTRFDFPRLRRNASSAVVKLPNGDIVLHDVGAEAAEIDELLASLPNQNGPLNIAIVISHLHSDHFRGIARLLDVVRQNPDKYIIHSVLIGSRKTPDQFGSEPERAALVTMLSAMFPKSDISKSWWIFSTGGIRSPSRLDFARSTRFGPDQLSLQVIRLRGDNGEPFTMRVLSVPSPDKGLNAESLVCSYDFKDFRVIDLADLPVAGVRTLLALRAHSSREQDFLSCNVLKWPHHAWRPLKDSDREGMVQLIGRCSPQVIVLEVGSENVQAEKSRIDAIRKIVEDAVRRFGLPEIEIRVTGEHGVRLHVRSVGDSRILSAAA